jgi:hypothetical protein
MTKTKERLSIIEMIVYYLTCIFTVGGAWVLKIIIQKAIIDSGEK